MGFFCEAAMCWSEDKKKKNLVKYTVDERCKVGKVPNTYER